MAKRDCDILIGTRGGMWFCFSNSRDGTVAIQTKALKVSQPNPEAAQVACEAVNLTWQME